MPKLQCPKEQKAPNSELETPGVLTNDQAEASTLRLRPVTLPGTENRTIQNKVSLDEYTHT